MHNTPSLILQGRNVIDCLLTWRNMIGRLRGVCDWPLAGRACVAARQDVRDWPLAGRGRLVANKMYVLEGRQKSIAYRTWVRSKKFFPGLVPGEKNIRVFVAWCGSYFSGLGL